jgi:hypothetical protein
MPSRGGVVDPIHDLGRLAQIGRHDRLEQLVTHSANRGGYLIEYLRGKRRCRYVQVELALNRHIHLLLLILYFYHVIAL